MLLQTCFTLYHSDFTILFISWSCMELIIGKRQVPQKAKYVSVRWPKTNGIASIKRFQHFLRPPSVWWSSLCDDLLISSFINEYVPGYPRKSGLVNTLNLCALLWVKVSCTFKKFKSSHLSKCRQFG